MKDASSSRRTRSGAGHRRGWQERLRVLLLGPIALLIMFGNALYRRFIYWRLVGGSAGNPRRRSVAALRRSDSTVVQMTDTARERPPRGLGARLALVSTKDVRRRGAATRLLRTQLTEHPAELSDAVIGNLRRCLSPAAVSVVVDDLSAKGRFRERELSAALDRLVELETCEADVKMTLAYGGLAVFREASVNRRIIKLRLDPTSGRMEWRHRAVRSLDFCLVGTSLMGGRPRDKRRLGVSVHFDGGGQIVGWDLPPHGQSRQQQ